MKTAFFGIALCCALSLLSSSTAFAQGANATAPSTQMQTLKPQLTVGDLVFTLNTLATVNINGSEVEAYLDVKNTFNKAFEQAQKDKKTETDVVTVEMSVLTANNFLQLFQRASFQGSAAEHYMAVKNALYASAPKIPPASGDGAISNQNSKK